ncbi:hypothetical protein ACYPKM_00975 [Pseudomonas aeruginosa]
MTLLELIMMIAISIGISMIGFYERTLQREQDRARVSGNYINQYNNATREWISANVGAAPATMNGSSWLKATSCIGGTSAVGYLPCSFPDASSATPIPGGRLALTSVIATTGVAPNLVTTVTTTTTPYTLATGQIRSDLAGLAAMVASAGAGSSYRKSGTDGSYNSNMSTGIITLKASNQSTTDAWLRTDGSNLMNGNIQFNGALPAGMREVQGVSRLQNIAVSALTVGNAGGAASGFQAIVDANQNTLGTMQVANNQNVAYGIDAVRGGIRTQSGNLQASNNITASNYIRAPRFTDSNNSTFYLDPNGTSQLAVGVNNATVTPILYDANNSGFYLDPNGTSYFNNLNVDTLNVWGNLYNAFRSYVKTGIQLAGPKSAVTVCPKLGLITIDTNGSVLSCVNGAYGLVWQLQPQAGLSFYSTYHAAGSTNVDETVNLGPHFYCGLVGVQTSKDQDRQCDLTGDLFNWYLQATTENASSNTSDHWCYVQCIDK